MSFPYLRRELNAAARHGRPREPLKPEHRPDPLGDSAVVLLNQAVWDSARQGADLLKFGDGAMGGGIGVQRDCPWHPVLPPRLAQEPFGGRDVARFAHENVHVAACFVRRVGQCDAVPVLSRSLNQVTGAQSTRQVPPHAQDDDLAIERAPFDEIVC